MGKAGRLACIAIPFLSTLASLICLILVLVGGLNRSSTLQRDLYFFKADLSDFKRGTNGTDPSSSSSSDSTLGDLVDAVDSLDIDIPGTDADDKLLDALRGAVARDDLRDVYAVYLWNYCAGSVEDEDDDEDEDDEDEEDGKDNEKSSSVDFTTCSDSTASFAFDPLEVWGLQDTAAQQLFPDALADGLDVYRQVSKAMFICYIVAAVATAVTVLLSGLAACSRFGSLVVTIAASISFFFTLAASLTATILFAVLAGAVNTALGPYNISASLGKPMLTTTWLATAFSAAAGLTWLVSTCCVSGRDSHHNHPGIKPSQGTFFQTAGYMGKRGTGYNELNANTNPAVVAGARRGKGGGGGGIGKATALLSRFNLRNWKGGHNNRHSLDAVPLTATSPLPGRASSAMLGLGGSGAEKAASPYGYNPVGSMYAGAAGVAAGGGRGGGEADEYYGYGGGGGGGRYSGGYDGGGGGGYGEGQDLGQRGEGSAWTRTRRPDDGFEFESGRRDGFEPYREV